MAIVNVTPDSFSGDGLNDDIAAAAVLARQFEREGADIIDVGAESTRPNADPITPAEETARALPAIRAIRKVVDLPISIDTQHAQVAEAALESGADIVNDINGLRGDPGMASIVASRGCALVAMHNQRGRKPGDVVTNTLSGWKESLRIAEKAGILRDQIIVDPGFGFGWTPEENLQLVQRLDELLISNLPLLLGPSRKSTLGLILDSAVEDRLEGTSATVAIAIAKGVDIVRVHDIAEVRKVAAVADAISRGRWQSP
ncbi:MAG TPA: dihydropteroate synthase [Dehalococcoidia bacterium]|nr:dihydropteroate synthase [Dehalococcoidia bacterium]|tara:strand:+ start:4148 stop:4921 length:774 start_codon:yes stop_codon:yes gene_type:complete